MDFASITQPVAIELQQFNNLVTETLDSDVPLIRQVSEHIISSGGKRMRPIVALLSARAAGFKQPIDTQSTNLSTINPHVTIATVIEFLHTSTLLHDDVVDNSTMRRNRPTANLRWGNAAPVLVGDYLLSKAFQLMTGLERIDLLKILSAATIVLAEGEVFQLSQIHNVDLSETDYFTIIHNKTAKLFEAAAHMGASLGDPQVIEPLKSYGLHLGTAFQLKDDLLDYSGDTELMGKNIGDDIREGKMTLPLIYTYKHSTDEIRQLIKTAIAHGSQQEIDQDVLGMIMAAMSECEALEYTQQHADTTIASAIEALDHLQASKFKTAMIQIAELSNKRSV